MLSMRFFVLALVAVLFFAAATDAARHHNKVKHVARNRHHVLAKQGVNAADKVNVLAHKRVGGADEPKKGRRHLVKVAGADQDKRRMMPAAGMVLNKNKNKNKVGAKKHHVNKFQHNVLAKKQVNAAGM